MGSPRVDAVFCFWQCDKENHGWREGPPRPSLASFDQLVGPSPSRLSQLQTKKQYTFSIGCEPSLTTLAGLDPHIGSLEPTTDAVRYASHGVLCKKPRLGV